MKWWKKLLGVIVPPVKEELERELEQELKKSGPKPGPWYDVAVADGRLIIKKAAEAVVDKIIHAEEDPLKTRKIKISELEDELEKELTAKLGESGPLSTLFGFKVDDTVVSPPVSESLDPLRRLVRQIINESRLSKDT